jgi:hypothetical protein
MAVVMYGMDKSDGIMAQKVEIGAFEINAKFDNPSKTTYNIQVHEEQVMHYLFSEFEYGKDWWMSTNTKIVAVTETVLTTLQLKFTC